jgi:hypothetical protein
MSYGPYEQLDNVNKGSTGSMANHNAVNNIAALKASGMEHKAPAPANNVVPIKNATQQPTVSDSAGWGLAGTGQSIGEFAGDLFGSSGSASMMNNKPKNQPLGLAQRMNRLGCEPINSPGMRVQV